jgi:DNA-binding response OmpR family regulator
MVGNVPVGSVIRVLVIENPVDEGTGLAAQLDDGSDGATRRSLRVRAVSDIDAARSALSEDSVGCVVCHHDPPALDCVETLAALREATSDLPILLATETTDSDTVRGSGATDVVSVSDGVISRDVVVNRIESIVAQARAVGTYKQIFEQANDGIVVQDPENSRKRGVRSSPSASDSRSCSRTFRIRSSRWSSSTRRPSFSTSTRRSSRYSDTSVRQYRERT